MCSTATLPGCMVSNIRPGTVLWHVSFPLVLLCNYPNYVALYGEQCCLDKWSEIYDVAMVKIAMWSTTALTFLQPSKMHFTNLEQCVNSRSVVLNLTAVELSVGAHLYHHLPLNFKEFDQIPPSPQVMQQDTPE